MPLLLVIAIMTAVVVAYFRHNPINHSRKFIFRRFINWFPLGMTYAFLYMARYNLAVSKVALGESMSIKDFGIIFAAGTITYGFSFLLNGPLVDKIGGKKGIILAALGACIANVGMGLVTYLHLHGRLAVNLTLVLAVLYAINMYFQSYGAVSIIKVKAYWFHVRERGIFGAIFGTLISFGLYFAYDWGNAIAAASKVNLGPEPTGFQRFFHSIFAVDTNPVDALWLIFFVPAALLVFWALIDMWLIKDTPSQANFEDFDTHDASSGEMEREFTIGELYRKIFTSRIMLIVAFIEFTTGVVRNGVLQWYFVFVKQVPSAGVPFFSNNWGLLLCLGGIFGGFAGGIVSDKFFQSRRAPPTALAQGAIFLAAVVMAIYLFDLPYIIGTCALIMSGLAITTHSLMSGTAAADFGGRKATATASGIVDGFVYLGSGIQSLALGFLITDGDPSSWQSWPIFMAPFALLGLALAVWIWHELPEATKKYLLHVEQVRISQTRTQTVITKTEADIEIVEQN